MADSSQYLLPLRPEAIRLSVERIVERSFPVPRYGTSMLFDQMTGRLTALAVELVEVAYADADQEVKRLRTELDEVKAQLRAVERGAPTGEKVGSRG